MNLFSLLGSSSSSSVDASSLVCVVILALYLTMNFVISSLIVVIFKSACNTLLSGFGGLEVACWPLVPTFAGSNLAGAVGFFRVKKSSARLPSEGK